MLWIEKRRLEMGVDVASEHAKSQLTRLKRKNKKALMEEFGDWLEGSEKIKLEDLSYEDHNNWW